jgi:HlyD family secretion protein
VLERRCDEGASIVAGDRLAVIDPSHLELQLASAEAGRGVVEANLATARLAVENAARAEQYAVTEFERAQRLLEASTASQRQFDEAAFQRDQAKIARRTAEANVAALKAQLAQTEAEIARLRRLHQDGYPLAPVTGIVTETYVEIGELLAPGRPLVKLAQLDTVWVKVYLTAGDFAGVTIGQRATVSTETGGDEHTGAVIWTSPEAEFTPKNVQTAQSRADLVYAVKVSIPNPERRLKVGMPVFVTLEQR